MCVTLLSLCWVWALCREAFRVGGRQNVLGLTCHSACYLSIGLLLTQRSPKDNNDEPKRWKHGVKCAQIFRGNAWVRATGGELGQSWRLISTWAFSEAVLSKAKRSPDVVYLPRDFLCLCSRASIA